jgi:hypothetical protein
VESSDASGKISRFPSFGILISVDDRQIGAETPKPEKLIFSNPGTGLHRAVTNTSKVFPNLLDIPCPN